MYVILLKQNVPCQLLYAANYQFVSCMQSFSTSTSVSEYRDKTSLVVLFRVLYSLFHAPVDGQCFANATDMLFSHHFHTTVAI